MVLTAADQRLTDTVEKDLANAALILASDIADGSRSRVEMMNSSRCRPGVLAIADEMIERRYALLVSPKIAPFGLADPSDEGRRSGEK